MRPLAYFVAITSVAAILSRPMEWPMALSLLAALVLSVLYLAEGPMDEGPRNRS